MRVVEVDNFRDFDARVDEEEMEDVRVGVPVELAAVVVGSDNFERVVGAVEVETPEAAGSVLSVPLWLLAFYAVGCV